MLELKRTVPQAASNIGICRCGRFSHESYRRAFTLQEHQAGPLTSLPNLPTQLDAATTAAYIQSVMTGAQPVPAPIAQQVAHILQLVESL